MKRTKATPAPEPVASAPRHRSRYKENRKAKTALNAERCEHRARTALVLGGGAPNMALMAGAVAAFHDCGVEFDVVSTSGAGGLAGLLWLAPKGKSPKEALHSVVTMSVVDQIYSLLPVNYKVFQQAGNMGRLVAQGAGREPVLQDGPESVRAMAALRPVV